MAKAKRRGEAIRGAAESGVGESGVFGEIGEGSALTSDFAEADGEEDEDGEGGSGGCDEGSYEVGRGGLGAMA